MAITASQSRRTRLLYGVGDSGFSLTSILIGVYFLMFLTDVVGLRPALAGAAIRRHTIASTCIGMGSCQAGSRNSRCRPTSTDSDTLAALRPSFIGWRSRCGPRDP